MRLSDLSPFPSPLAHTDTEKWKKAQRSVLWILMLQVGYKIAEVPRTGERWQVIYYETLEIELSKYWVALLTSLSPNKELFLFPGFSLPKSFQRDFLDLYFTYADLRTLLLTQPPMHHFQYQFETHNRYFIPISFFFFFKFPFHWGNQNHQEQMP